MPSCPSCASENPASAKFCLQCGRALAAAAGDEIVNTAAAPTVTSARDTWSSAHSSDGRFPPGTLLAGRYRIASRLGRGGMGEVYRADDMKLGQAVALKFLPPSLQRDSAALARFHHEVRIARQVSHPNVCRVYDIVEAEGQHFISMEYVDGEDLKALLRRIGRLPEDKALQIARQMCAGLAAAHDKGVLHRDLKPANVMLDGDGRVRITDFGLAAIADEISGADLRSGTPGYMAPEQLAGREVSVASDIYSLGLVLFELFTGKPAFKAASLNELRAQQESGVSSPSSHVPGIDRSVERVIIACLSPHPAERPSSALAVAAALPGGDPLAAALAAGETPSPEVVAASVVTGSVSVPAAVLSVAVVVIGLVLLMMFGGRYLITSRAPLTYEPQVLTAQARQLLARIGYTDPPADFLWAFRTNAELTRRVRASRDPARWEQLGAGVRSPLLYVYRQSPGGLLPRNPVSYRMTPSDPLPTTPGTASVWTDTSGQLVRLEVLPPQRADAAADAARPADWTPLLTAAGLDPATLRAVEPAWNPPFHTGARQAWEVESPAAAHTGLRVEAASLAGRPVFFRVIGPWETSLEPERPPTPRSARIGGFVVIGLFFVVTAAAFVLARRNVRLGRSDLRGAFRLAALFVTMHLVAWVLYTKYPINITDLFPPLMMTMGISLVEGLLLYTLYLALEPFVRRRWPDSLVGWTRALAGRLRDPLVGRDVLVGCVLGIGMRTVELASVYAAERTGNLRVGDMDLGRLSGMRFLVGEFIDAQSHAFVTPFMTLILLVLASIVLKRSWLAFGVVLAIFVGIGLTQVGTPGLLALRAASNVLTWGGLMFVLTRYGLLAATVGSAAYVATIDTVATTDLTQWYAAGVILAAVWILALALYGAYTALAGRPLISAGWLEE